MKDLFAREPTRAPILPAEPRAPFVAPLGNASDLNMRTAEFDRAQGRIFGRMGQSYQPTAAEWDELEVLYAQVGAALRVAREGAR